MSDYIVKTYECETESQKELIVFCMLAADEMPENEYFKIPKDARLSIEPLKLYCKFLSRTLNKKFIADEENHFYRIERLSDADSVADYYKEETPKHFAPRGSAIDPTNAAMNLVKEVIKKFAETEFDKLPAYEKSCTPEMKVQKLIPRSFIARRVSGYSCFRRHPEGPSAFLDQTLEKLVAAGELKKLEQEKAMDEFHVNAVLYCFGSSEQDEREAFIKRKMSQVYTPSY